MERNRIIRRMAELAQGSYIPDGYNDAGRFTARNKRIIAGRVEDDLTVQLLLRTLSEEQAAFITTYLTMLALSTLDKYIRITTQQRDDAAPGSTQRDFLRGRVQGLRAARRSIAAGLGNELPAYRTSAEERAREAVEAGIQQWWYGVESAYYTTTTRGKQ